MSPPRFALDNVDTWRGPTASQAAGLTLGAARAVIAAVQAEARSMGVAMSCAVVDSGDQLVAFERMDAADLVTVTLARDQAFTALANRMPARPGAAGPARRGVLRLRRGRGRPDDRVRGRDAAGLDGVLVGAVGVSGGSSEEDQRAADAGVRVFTGK